MTTKKKQTIQAAQELSPVTEASLVIQDDLLKPEQDTQFAHSSAKRLKDIVNQNGWARKFGGASEHLQYEAWQTLGKYYGLTVDTDKVETEYIEIAGTWGFKAHAEVIDNKSGLRVGGASALCMSDEGNWRNKPKFQLNSMAQTRAGSKALRQILGFVVALAGYEPTPAEEMEGVHQTPSQTSPVAKPQYTGLATPGQIKFIRDLLLQKHYNETSFLNKYDITEFSQLTFDQASDSITNLKNAPIAQKKMVTKAEEEVTQKDYSDFEQSLLN